jgi:predicted amidohydrolase YtcJ
MLVRLALGLIACMSLADMCWAADAELILTHGKIITVDDQFSIVEAVAIADGRVLATGMASDIERLPRAPGARVVDLRGKTVIPGLIDGHIHFLRGADFWQSEVRFQGITRRAAALEALRVKAREVGPDTWIMSIGGWSEDQFSDDQTPFSRQELDAAAPHNPLYLQVGYGRAHANSAAFDKAGINLVDAAKVDQEIVERDGTGSATGRLMGPRGIALVRRAFPARSVVDKESGALAMARSLNALGITAVYDPGGIGVKAADYEPLERLARAGELPVRVFRALWIDTPGLAQVEATVATIRNTRAFQGSDRYDLVAIGEAVYSPQHDNFRQPLRPSPAEAEAMRAIFDAAAETGLAFHMHAIEHDTAGLYLDLIEQVAKARNIRALRWTLAHVWTLSPDQIVRLRNLGMNVALQSGSSFDATRLRTAGDAGLAMPPLKMVQDSGLPWGLGTDATVVGQVNPFITLAWAATGTMPSGRRVNNTPVAREQALIAHTRANAYLAFRENSLGSLQAGKLADLVVLDRDYLTVPADQLFAIRPVATMVGGRLVHGTLD